MEPSNIIKVKNFLEPVMEKSTGQERRFATYKRCTVCGDILSHKKKKLHQVNRDLFVHKGCYAIMVRKVREQTEKDKLKGEVTV